jgi:hypothetical protein
MQNIKCSHTVACFIKIEAGGQEWQLIEAEKRGDEEDKERE